MGWGGGAEQRSARQLCAANLWHTEQCATTVRCKLAAHIVYQNSVRQLCAANLRRTLCTRTVRDNCAPQTCGAHCVPEQCARKVICIRKTRLRQTRRNYKPQTCYKFAAYLRLIYTRDLIFW